MSQVRRRLLSTLKEDCFAYAVAKALDICFMLLYHNLSKGASDSALCFSLFLNELDDVHNSIGLNEMRVKVSLGAAVYCGESSDAAASRTAFTRHRFRIEAILIIVKRLYSFIDSNCDCSWSACSPSSLKPRRQRRCWATAISTLWSPTARIWCEKPRSVFK